MVMSTAKKVTTILPEELLKKAQKVTGEGQTQTIKMGLELLAKREIYQKIRSYRGKYKFSLDLDKLRQD